VIQALVATLMWALVDRLAAGIRGSVFAESRYSEIFG